MRRLPDGAAVLDEKRLRRFVPNLKAFRDGVRQLPILKHENDAADQVTCAIDEIRELLVGLHGDSALRAMLENEDWISTRTLKKLFKILLSHQLNHHEIRLADRRLNEER